MRPVLTPLLPLASSSRLGASLLLPPPSSSSSSFASSHRSISDMPPRYPGHIPLTPIEKVVLTLGSAGAALLNPRRADMIAALSETTSTPFLPRLRDTMFSTPEGRAILRDRPRIHSEIIDLDHLRSLPDGTVGRSYCDWLERTHTSPDTRLPVQHVDDPELAYVLQRYRETHDFSHTLFNLPSTLLPELALKLFEAQRTQTGLPMPFLSSLTIFSPFNTLTPAQRSTLVTKYLPWAAEAGRKTKPLIGVYWERRWEQGMDDLRAELGVVMPGEDGGKGEKWDGMVFKKGTLKERKALKEEKERRERELEEMKRETEVVVEKAEKDGKVAVAPGS
ncbi:coenzyme Q biosynthesis protein Coq4-domain-containing protein [Mrakia frigida]|uniref:ubiquinone biosynthesis protein COQ4 n=1 Tax=Mrakia frigida TaxID=29902 RepID=UPI003FCC10C9